MAALAKLIQKTEGTVQKHRLIVNTSHAVQAFIQSSAFSITPGRERQAIDILTQPHTAYCNNRMNMAEAKSDEQRHECKSATI